MLDQHGVMVSTERLCMLIPNNSTVSLKTLWTFLYLSTTIVWEKPTQVQIFMIAEANDLALCLNVGLRMAKVVMLQHAIR